MFFMCNAFCNIHTVLMDKSHDILLHIWSFKSASKSISCLGFLAMGYAVVNCCCRKTSTKNKHEDI